MSDGVKKKKKMGGRHIGEKDKCEVLERLYREQAGTNGKKAKLFKVEGWGGMFEMNLRKAQVNILSQ